MRHVSVRLRDSYGGYSDKVFTFKTHMNDLEEGDKVVVDAANEIHIGIIVDEMPNLSLPYYKYVLAKIDREGMIKFLTRLEASE